MAHALASRLVLLDADGVPERPVLMNRDRLVLGRSADSDVVLRDPQVSRHHAELRMDHGRWVLRDLGSTAGTTRGGHRLERPVVLRHGDVIGLGPVHLRYEQDSAEPPTTIGPAVPAAVPRPRPPVPAAGIGVRDQRAGSINNVEGVQNNYVQQILHERQSFMREVAATRTRARFFIWLGILMVIAGLGTGFLVVGGSLSFLNGALGSNGEVEPPTDFFGKDVGGVPLVVVAAALNAFGILLIVIGIVLHVVATARRKDVDRRLPDPRIPRYR
jgi:hypothetical protein